MNEFKALGAWIVDKDGNRREVSVPRVSLLPPPENNEPQTVYHLADALRNLTFEIQIMGEAAKTLSHWMRQVEYRHNVAPMRYRVQFGSRGRLVKLGGVPLRAREDFVRRLLSGE